MSGSGSKSARSYALRPDTLLRDFIHAWRVIRRRRGFALAIVGTLGLGIGANAAVFGLIETVLLSPLPYATSEELYGLSERHTSGQLRIPSYPTYLDLRGETELFEGLAFARGAPVTYRGEGYSGLLLGAFVTDGFFDLLGTPATVGRVLDSDDYRADADGAALLSERAWRSYFASEPEIIGTTLAVGERLFTVVGVMPQSFAYPDWGADNDMWFPISHLPAAEAAALGQRGFGADSRVVARIGRDVDPADVRAAGGRFASRMSAAYPETYAGWSIALDPLKELEIRSVRPRLLVLWGAALLLLTMCCLNLSNLYLVQGSSRRREYAIRAALGAGQGRVFTQVVSETLLLTVGGGAVGLVVAELGLSWARTQGFADLPRIAELALDWQVVAFAGLLSIGTALLFALSSVRHAGAVPHLGAVALPGGQPVRSPSLLSAVQAAQIGVTFLLLLGAWLLGETLLRLTRVEPGYEEVGLMALQINPPSPTYDDERAAVQLYSELIDRVEAVPGVVSVALTNHGPGGLRGLPTAAAVGRAPEDPQQDLSVYYRTVSTGYFSTIGTRLVAGREFSRSDLEGAEGPVIINEALARLFGGPDQALGSTLGVRKAASSREDFGEPLVGTVVGVVADLAPSETAGREALFVYVPFTHTPWAQVRLLVRGLDTSPSLIRAVEEAVRSREPNIPLSGPLMGVERLEDLRVAQRSRERLNARLTAAFAALAVLLASLGMYGVTSFIVTLQKHELGVRLALGATRPQLYFAIVRRAVIVGVIGLAIGMVGALAASRSVAGLLYEVSPVDTVRYALVAAILLCLTAFAAFVPAYRAGRLDPARVLRAE